MIPVKTQPRFKCDFCKKRSTRAGMELHERRCYRNPDRFCDYCQNTGIEAGDGSKDFYPPCPYCAKFDKQQLADIEAYERENQ